MASKSKSAVTWSVVFHDDFDSEFDALDDQVQDNLLAAAKAVRIAGPQAGRPYVDTLKGSKHANMKELRFEGQNGSEEWRAAFAFDPERKAVILVAGAKQGVAQKRFYKQLISVADKRFDAHLQTVKGARKRKG
jgi:hypothetical protein